MYDNYTVQGRGCMNYEEDDGYLAAAQTRERERDDDVRGDVRGNLAPHLVMQPTCTDLLATIMKRQHWFMAKVRRLAGWVGMCCLATLTNFSLHVHNLPFLYHTLAVAPHFTTWGFIYHAYNYNACPDSLGVRCIPSVDANENKGFKVWHRARGVNGNRFSYFITTNIDP